MVRETQRVVADAGVMMTFLDFYWYYFLSTLVTSATGLGLGVIWALFRS